MLQPFEVARTALGLDNVHIERFKAEDAPIALAMSGRCRCELQQSVLTFEISKGISALGLDGIAYGFKPASECPVGAPQ